MARTPFHTPSSVGVGVWAFADGNRVRRKTLARTKGMEVGRFLIIERFTFWFVSSRKKLSS
jgi:hypothetical protein